MSYYGAAGSDDNSIGRGTRRRKFAGYLRAANEIRQSYRDSNARRSDTDDESNIPGAFPDLKVAQNGTEEMVLFPSYAKRHVRKTEDRPSTGIGGDDLRRNANVSGDAEYWKKEWEIHEDANAVVDVDVRGWIYTPQRGPMNRKNRLVMGIARRLSGIPAPTQESRANSRSSSVAPARKDKHEDEVADREAQHILQRGEHEADVADRGGYSEEPACVDSGLSSRSSSPRPGQISHPITQTSLDSTSDATEGSSPKWPQPGEMSPEELFTANTHLTTRLQPFMATPAVGMALTIFFFNEETSQSRTTRTNDSGHFNFRAALNFVPTNIRVLASEKLSATEEVLLTEPHGISLISDIDDTVKHSAIGGRTRDIFLNIFIRELETLAIKGVSQWYHSLAKLGVKIHYVSNSPWQMFPLLYSFFVKAQLPPGSYHLKQYTGMFQGIFEPVAERKRGTIDRLMQDFPERRFILVGDSGEADLEVYTDTALMNPGRVLGIFIRDVTTTPKPSMFDTSMSPSKYASGMSTFDGSSTTVTPEQPGKHRPPLPPRLRTEAPIPSSASDVGDLIDFSEDTEPGPLKRSETDPLGASELQPLSRFPSNPPPPPSKPLALRTKSNELADTDLTNHAGKDRLPNLRSETSKGNGAAVQRKAIPPPPPKPRKLSASVQQKNMDAIKQGHTNGAAAAAGTVGRATQAKLTAAYNMLPSATLPWSSASTEQNKVSTEQDGGSRRNSAISTSSADSDSSVSRASKRANKKAAPPPLPPRRQAGGLSTSIVNAWGGASTPGSLQAVDRRVDLWQRRWARAEAALKPKGIMLMTWREGSDVQGVTEKLVKEANESAHGSD